jgi:phage terminase small subunit
MMVPTWTRQSSEHHGRAFPCPAPHHAITRALDISQPTLYRRVGMTPKQQSFVDHYLIDLNATQAAIRAGYSARTAEQQGSRLLGNAEIAQAVRVAQQARSDRVQITQDDVLQGLRREATLTGEGSSHAARVSAWGLIARHLGMLVERRQLLGADGQPTAPQLFTLSITGLQEDERNRASIGARKETG